MSFIQILFQNRLIFTAHKNGHEQKSVQEKFECGIPKESIYMHDTDKRNTTLVWFSFSQIINDKVRYCKKKTQCDAMPISNRKCLFNSMCNVNILSFPSGFSIFIFHLHICDDRKYNNILVLLLSDFNMWTM